VSTLFGHPSKEFALGGAISCFVRRGILAAVLTGALRMPMEAALSAGCPIEIWKVRIEDFPAREDVVEGFVGGNAEGPIRVFNIASFGGVFVGLVFLNSFHFGRGFGSRLARNLVFGVRREFGQLQRKVYVESADHDFVVDGLEVPKQFEIALLHISTCGEASCDHLLNSNVQGVKKLGGKIWNRLFQVAVENLVVVDEFDEHVDAAGNHGILAKVEFTNRTEIYELEPCGVDVFGGAEVLLHEGCGLGLRNGTPGKLADFALAVLLGVGFVQGCGFAKVENGEAAGMRRALSVPSQVSAVQRDGDAPGDADGTLVLVVKDRSEAASGSLAALQRQEL
jgi:hypothetical protein